MSAPRTPGGEAVQPPQPVMAGALAAQPAPAPAAAADAVERFRTTLGEYMQTEERIVIPDEFAIEGARVGLAKLARLAALPPGALDAVFSRTGVHKRLMRLHIRNALGRYHEREAEPHLAEARSCV